MLLFCCMHLQLTASWQLGLQWVWRFVEPQSAKVFVSQSAACMLVLQALRLASMALLEPRLIWQMGPPVEA